MAALVCDICGGKLVVRAGGIAVCDSCGMEHSQDRMREKIQEIKGVVRIDNTHMIDSWMKLGTSAAQAGNYKEAYEYFKKVIEVDPENWRAIHEKGKAAAWQFAADKIRTAEIHQGSLLALEIIERSDMSEEEIVRIRNEFTMAEFEVSNAITDSIHEKIEKLEKSDDLRLDIHKDQMERMINRFIENVSQLEEALSFISEYEDEVSKGNVIKIKKRMCKDIREACEPIRCWENKSKDDWAYLGISQAGKEEYLELYWKLADAIRETEPEYATDEWSCPDPFEPGLHFRSECYSFWQKFEAEHQEMKEREARKKRFDAYWAEHIEDRQNYEARIAEIDSELKRLGEQIGQYDSRIYEIEAELPSEVPAVKELEEIKRQQNELEEEKSKLGSLAYRQKKNLQEQIAMLQRQVENLEENIRCQQKSMVEDAAARISVVKTERQPFEDKMNELEKEKARVNEELTRER